MADIGQARSALLARIMAQGDASLPQRAAAFDNRGLAEPLRTLIEKVATRAHTVTDADIAAARGAGLTENQIFEIVICGAIGQANRQYESGLAALAAATEKE